MSELLIAATETPIAPSLKSQSSIGESNLNPNSAAISIS